MAETVFSFKQLLGDRIQWMAILVVACFVSVLLLASQSGASYPTYALSILMLCTFRYWSDVLRLTPTRWILALLVWLSASAFWSEPFVLRDAVSVWTRSLLVFFFVVAVAECQLRGQLQQWMAKALVVVGAGAMTAALINFYITDPADGRLNGLGQLDTHVIAALVYGVVLIFGLRIAIVEAALPWRLLAVVVVLTASVCIFLSDSRTAWVSVTLGAVTYLLAHKIRDAKQLILTLIAVSFIGTVVFLVIIANDEIRNVVLPRGDSFRVTIWGETLARIVESPIIGLGIITPDDVRAGGMVFHHPHNIYLSLLMQGGVVGLALYLMVLARTFGTVLNHYERVDAKLAGSILVLASSAFLLDGHELVDKVGEAWFLIWLPVGLAIGLGWRPKTSP